MARRRGVSGVVVEKAELERMIRVAPQETQRKLASLVFEGEAYVKRLFGSGPPGRAYEIGGVIHVASSPGYPPNVDTGKLRNAIYSQALGPYEYIISTGDTEYAAALEFGTRRIAARPYMGPTADYLRDLVPTHFRGLFR